MMPTSSEISEKLAALDIALSDAGAEFDRHASAAVAGEPDAGKKATEVNSRIERLKIERRILESAFKRAERDEAEAAAKAYAAVRARHMEMAREHALKLIEVAERADSLIAELTAVMADLDEGERVVWSELRQARTMPPGSVPGRNGLSGRAAGIVKVLAEGQKFRSDPRGVADLARVGWRFLIETDEQEAA